MNKKIFIFLFVILSFFVKIPFTSAGLQPFPSPTIKIVSLGGENYSIELTFTMDSVTLESIKDSPFRVSLAHKNSKKGATVSDSDTMETCAREGSTSLYTCPIQNLKNGDTEVFQVGINKNTALGVSWSPLYQPATTTINEPVSTPSFTLQGKPVVSGMTATATVNASNLPAQGGIYYLELGDAMSKSGASNYTCTMNSGLRSPEIPAGHGNPNTISYTFTLPLPGGYCVGLLQKNLNGSVRTPDGVPEYFPDSLFFTDGVTPPPGATLSGTANKLGCVAGDGNSGYCLLAPLPGIGDPNTGYIDVTKGMGNYINMIIRLVLGLIGVLAVFMIIVGGIEYMSTVSLGEKEGARTRITNALFGLLLALASYILLNTINPNLVSLKVAIPNATIEYASDEGNETSDITPPTPNISGIQVFPSDTAQNLAKQILKTPAITYRTLQDEATATPKQNIEDTAAGNSAMTSSRGDVGAQKVALAAPMLTGLLTAAKFSSIEITEITGGKHSPGSAHYFGRAFDVTASKNDTSRNIQVMNACLAAKAKMSQIFGPCSGSYRSDGKFTICADTGYLTNKDHQTHIHCGW